jgi:hypothetical protein
MIAKNLEKLQCPICINVLCGRNSLMRHLITKHDCGMKELNYLENKYYLGKINLKV